MEQVGGKSGGFEGQRIGTAGKLELVGCAPQRKQEVLRLVAEGLTNKEIAARLGLSERTAAFHVSNVHQKLGAVSRTEAVVKAKERGIIGCKNLQVATCKNLQ